MGIKLRSIDADELRFSSYGHAAGTAHTRSIDHDGVERSLGRDIVFGGSKRHELHHDSRTDGDTFIDGLAVDHFFYADGDDTLFAHRAIIGHDDEFVRPLRELIFEDDEVFVTGSKDGDDLVSGFLERLSNRQHRRSSDTTAGTNDRSVVLNTGSTSERSNDVVQTVARVHGQELMGRSADLLNNQRDGSFFDIRSGDGQRDALRVSVHTDDDKMSGSAATRNERSFYDELRYIRRKEFFRNDLIH